MTKCTARWFVTIIFATLMLQQTVLAGGKKTTRDSQKSTTRSGKTGHKDDLSDLEGSETSYSFPFLQNSYNSMPSYSVPSGVSFFPSYTGGNPSSYNFGFVQNVTNDIHQEIRCGDNYPRGCGDSRYRTYDGSCNNLYHPTWGMANTRYGRLLPANYGDDDVYADYVTRSGRPADQPPQTCTVGVELPHVRSASGSRVGERMNSEVGSPWARAHDSGITASKSGIRSPTTSVTGSNLPPSRMVSTTLFPYVDINDPIWTLGAMQWGQIMTHDMALIDGTTQSKPHATQCCTAQGQLVDPLLLHGQCYPIIIPYDDHVYSKANIRCLNFVRSTTDLDRGCSSQYKPAEQLTVVTHYLDLSLVYGSNDQVAASLRAGAGGRLNVDVRHNRQWPPSATNKSQQCETVDPGDVCYQTGDTRTNQNPQLAVLQIILLREHNRVADALAHINPHWTDETIFQEARRIVIAEHQHISYYEWLPIFLGIQNTYGLKILYDTDDYVNDYDPNVNPSVLNEHSTAAFRYFHSLIAGFLNIVTRHRATTASLRLSDHLNRPGVIEEFDNMDGLTRGMSYQPQKASDQYFDAEITQFLFRNGQPLGQDLRAIDIQRSRDHGLASYNHFREYCGLPRAKYFSDFTDYISLSNVEKLSQLYASPDDVDLTVGGSLETHVPGTLSGPTFLCILTRQFIRTRVGDRYWYERGDHQSAFTLEQLNEIRKASISRLFCDNGDHIQNMQPKGFEAVSPKNPITSCANLPSVDLTSWKDYAPEITNHQHLHFPQYKK